MRRLLWLLALWPAFALGQPAPFPPGPGPIPGVPASVYKQIFNLKAYGAACDGTTDDTAAWQSLLVDLNAAGGGSIQVPNCTTRVQPGVIHLPSNSSLMGQGLGSVIQWIGSPQSGTYLVDASGTSQGSISGYITIANITLSANPSGGNSALLRMYYTAHDVIYNVWGNGDSAGFLDAVQLWDTRFSDIQCDFCGTSDLQSAVFVATGSGTNLTVASITSGVINLRDSLTGTGISGLVRIVSQTSGTPGGAGVYVTSASTTASGATITAASPPVSFHLRNASAASGFGYSTDNSNQDYFTNIRTESFYGSAFVVEQGVINTSPPNGIFVTDLKAESVNLTSDPIFYVGAGTDFSSFTNLYLAADSWSSGSTPIDLFEDFSAGNNLISGLYLYMGTASLVANPLNINAAGVEGVSNVSFVSAAGQSTIPADINITGGTQPIFGGFINNNVSQIPVTGGTGFSVLSATPGSTSLFGALFCNGTLCGVLGAPFGLTVYTVATLPASGVGGEILAVGDAVTCVSGSTPVGSGSVKCPLYWNGSAWVH